MFKLYDTEFIDRLCGSVNLTELMRSYGIDVRIGAGKNDYFKSWCCKKVDFDNGRIDKDKQSYRCNACMGGAGPKGKNAIHFLREYAGKSYPEAVAELCERTGIPLPEVKTENDEVMIKKRRQQLALELAVEFFEGHETTYFTERGISEDVQKRARVGYAPGGRALRTFLQQKGFTKDELIEYRLMNKNGLDSMFHRAIVPVFLNGQVVDIYGRAVKDDDKVKHFYLYGDRILGGIDLVDSSKVVLLFESAIDRLAAESHEMMNGVDPGGALKFNTYHLNLLLKKGVKNTVTLYDGDAAGEKGALATGDMLTDKGIQNHVVEFPQGKDVAQLLQEGGLQAVMPFTKAAMPFKRFRTFQILKDMDLEDIEAYMERVSLCPTI